MLHRLQAILVLVGVLLFAQAGMALPSPADLDHFRKQVAPLLRARCLSCHHARKARGGLDLSTRAALLEGGDRGAAVVPGKPGKSLLIHLVTGARPRMPRKGEQLTRAEVAVLKKWIARGLAWPAEVVLKAPTTQTRKEGWAWQRLTQPGVPSVSDPSWLRTPVDGFVLAQLEKRGLKPAPRADRRTLLRRLTFDLHGLPPTPAEMDAFLADQSPNAYEKVVERLLASPAYGERWARHWLDVVHYGDTHGYDKDKRRDHAWPYRDYVIRAFNADKPYPRFIREQLAGDVLYPGDPDAVVATGFIAAGPWDFVGHVELREGTVDKMKTRLLDRDDMVTNTCSTFLSLTVHCARCHDHKFDPIAQKDYYRLQAVFAGVERGDRPYAPNPSGARADTNRLAQQARLEQQAKELMTRVRAQETKIKNLTSPELRQLEAQLSKAQAELGALPRPVGQGRSQTNGYHSAILRRPDATRWVQVDLGMLQTIDEVRLFPARPVDFPDTPGFGFPQRFRVEVGTDLTFRKAHTVADHTASNFPNPGDTPVIISFPDYKARYVRVTATRLWLRRGDWVFALGEMQVCAGGKNLAQGARVTAFDSIEAGRWSRKHLVDGHDSRHRLPDLSDRATRLSFQRWAGLARKVQELQARRAKLATALVPASLRKQLDEARARLTKVNQQRKKIRPDHLVYAVKPRAPRPIWLLQRGDVQQRKERVQAGALALLQGLDGNFQLSQGEQGSQEEGARRAALAHWIAHPRNPLTWRSLANRVWHYHVGRGIVTTPNDFGANGARPTHPQLLDWLACQLREGGSLKELHRLIVLSATYQQSSRHHSAHARLDAGNRYLWRMNRRRLDAESVRDSILAVSGQLRREMGGPGFELFRFKNDHSPVYDHSAKEKILAPGTFRRTVYRFTVRSVPNPFLDCLDCADPNVNVPVRNTTLTALQALALLNNPFMLHQARLFAERLKKQSSDPHQQITLAYRLAFGRSPRDSERNAVVAYLRKHGLVNTCRLLFNANEFVFVD